jgi:hypothetical protein
MNWSSWLLWGFVATLVETTLALGAQGMGFTRMNLPYMLGTMFSPDRDKAKRYGFLFHFLSGWVFSLAYVLVFESIGHAGWWRGMVIGLIHAAFLLVVVVGLLPAIHPRMASEHSGPAAQNVLEPPGFLALHYGKQTPLAILLSHALFGAILGAFYHLK